MHQIPPNKTFALLLQDVARLLRKEIDQRAHKVGLTSAQWRVLGTVARCKSLNQDPLNQAHLADILDIEPITLSRQVDRLATAGLIERRPDPADRRAHRLHLTEAAWPLVQDFRDQAGEVVARAFDGIDDNEIETLTAALDRIRSNLTGKDVATDPTVVVKPRTPFRQKSLKQGLQS